MRYLKEFKALGTAGGLYYFKNEIMSGSPDNFFVIHGDIVCSFPLQKMIDFYEQKTRENGSKKLDAILMGVQIQNYDVFLALNDRSPKRSFQHWLEHGSIILKYITLMS